MTSPSELYQQLLSLCLNNPAFMYQDQTGHCGSKFRIFTYRLASYSDFLAPGALECRGSMFEVDADGGYIRIASRTPKKFFNLGENPFTMNLDLSEPALVMTKEDGSLMSTYIDRDGEINLKSKGSTRSTQCVDAMRYLDANSGLKADLKTLTSNGLTVNLEWTAPWNRIVVGYTESKLTGLSIIENETGDVFGLELVEAYAAQELSRFWVTRYEYDGDLAENIRRLVGSEGVVCITKDGTTCKIKSEWYVHLHSTRDSLDNAKSLIQLVLMEELDDLKSIFAGDEQATWKVSYFEGTVSALYNQTCARIEDFHDEHQGKGRKEYAIAAKEFWGTGIGFGAQMLRMCDRDYQGNIKSQILKLHAEFAEGYANAATASSIQFNPEHPCSIAQHIVATHGSATLH